MLRRDVAGVGRVRRLAHAVRVDPPRVRARARRHDERRGGQRAAQDARGAAALRRPAAADRQPVAGAADHQLALPARALRPAARRPSSPQRSSRAGSTPRPPPPAPGSRSATASARSTLALERPSCAPAPRPSRAPRCTAARTPSRPGARCSTRPAGAGAAAKREVEAALAEELEYLPKKEHRRRETEFTERARRAERRAIHRRARARAPAHRPLVPRPRLRRRRRRGARPPQRPARRRCARTPPGATAPPGAPRSTTVDDTRAALLLNVSEELALEALAYRLES